MVKFLYGVMIVLLVGGVSASLDTSTIDFYGRPMVGGSLQPLSSWSYDFVFSDSNTCSPALLNLSHVIVSDSYGVVNKTLDLSSLSVPPTYMCEYRNGSLRKVSNVNKLLLWDLRLTSVGVTGTSTKTLQGNFSDGVVLNATFSDIDYKVANVSVTNGSTHTISVCNTDGTCFNATMNDVDTDTDTDTNTFTANCSVSGTASKTATCYWNNGSSYQFTWSDSTGSISIGNYDSYITLITDGSILNGSANLSAFDSRYALVSVFNALYVNVTNTQVGVSSLNSSIAALSANDTALNNSLSLKAGTGSCSGSNSTHVNVTMNTTTSGVQCVEVALNPGSSTAYTNDSSVNITSTVISLPYSGVTASTYGNGSHVSQVTVNNRGVVTSVANVAISLMSGSIVDFSSAVVAAVTSAWPNLDTDSTNDLTSSTIWSGDLAGTGSSVQVNNNSHTLDWDNLTNVPAGFADGTDDTGSGSGGINTIQSLNTGILIENGSLVNATLNVGYLNNTHTLDWNNVTGKPSLVNVNLTSVNATNDTGSHRFTFTFDNGLNQNLTIDDQTGASSNPSWNVTCSAGTVPQSFAQNVDGTQNATTCVSIGGSAGNTSYNGAVVGGEIAFVVNGTLLNGTSNLKYSNGVRPVVTLNGSLNITNVNETIFKDKFPSTSNSKRYLQPAHVEFHSCVAGGITPLTLTAASSGTLTQVNSANGRVGVCALRDSTTANGAMRVFTDVLNLAFNGSEKFTADFYNGGTRTTASWRLGFQDSITYSTLPTDGCYFNWTQGTGIQTACANGAARTTGTGSFTPTTSQWYTGIIYVTPTKSQVEFYIYNESGHQQFQNNITSNIPASTAYMTWGGIAGESSTDAAADILGVDYFTFEKMNPLHNRNDYVVG
jgi:hypothetical protein